MRTIQFEIVKAYPPNIDEIIKVFPQATKPGVLFCWGNKIYNPSKVVIPDYLIAHENVHRVQQQGWPERWWAKYLVDKEFRLAQELPAHQAEFEQYWIDTPNRNMRRVMLTEIAKRLSGPLYGNMISFDKAKRLIKQEPRTK